MKEFALRIHKLTKRAGHDEVYQLLCRLAWTVWKLYDDEEQLDALIEECEMWYENPQCFDK